MELTDYTQCRLIDGCFSIPSLLMALPRYSSYTVSIGVDMNPYGQAAMFLAAVVAIILFGIVLIRPLMPAIKAKLMTTRYYNSFAYRTPEFDENWVNRAKFIEVWERTSD